MKINRMLALLLLINSMGAMEAPLNPKNAISVQLKKELVEILRIELSKKPTDISRKSDHKLQQLVAACRAILSNKSEVASIAKILNTSEKQIVASLNSLLQRAQDYLHLSAKKKAVPVSKVEEEVQVTQEKIATPVLAAPTPQKQQKNELPVIIVEEKRAPKISLWEAAVEGDLAAVEWHLAHGTNVNGKSPGGESALALAANRGDQAMVARLIKAGAQLDSRNLNGHSALHFAMFRNHFPIVKQLIAAGADVNIADHSGATPLMEAVLHNDVPMAEYLIVSGADVHARDKNGQTASDMAQGPKYKVMRGLLESQTNNDYLIPVNSKNKFIIKDGKKVPVLSIWQAAARGDAETVSFHLNNGVDINAEDDNGENALSLAIKNSHIPLMMQLLKKGAKNPGELAAVVNPVEGPQSENIWDAAENGDIASGIWFLNNGLSMNAKNENGETPLMVAAHYDQTEVIKELIGIKASLNEQDAQGNTALMRALEEKNGKSAKLLLDAGTNLSIKNKEGQTALFIAVSRGLGQVVKDLLAQGANPNEKDENDYTPLMTASYLDYSNSEIIPSLIAAGAQVNAQDDDGITALMVAAARKSPHAIKQLLSAGARIDIEDVTGKTALDYAIEGKHQEIITILTDAASYITKLKKTKKALDDLPKNFDFSLKLPAREKVLGSMLPISPVKEPKHKEIEPISVKAPEVPVPVEVAQPRKIVIKKLTPKLIAKQEPAAAAREPVAPKPNVVARDVLLLKAVKKGKMPEVQQLLKQGANVNAQNGKGETPLLIASRWGQIPIVKMLLNNHANPNIAEETGIVPLQSAVMAGHLEIAKMLLDSGANVNAQDTMRKRTPVNWVVRMTVGSVKKIAAQIPMDKSVLLLNLLLAYGANAEIPDYKGITPLKWTRKMGFTPLVKILERK